MPTTKKRVSKSVRFHPEIVIYPEGANSELCVSIFNNNINKYNESPTQTEEHTPNQVESHVNDDCWYSNDELISFKLRSAQKAMAVREQHEAHRLQPYSYSNTLLAAYLLCCGTTPATRSSLTTMTTNNFNANFHPSILAFASRLAQANPKWRGLEFQSVETVRMERARRRQLARQTVLSLQRCFEEWNLKHGTSSSDYAQQEMLRQASEEISCVTKLFALVLAQADAMAAKHVYHHDQHNKLAAIIATSDESMLPNTRLASKLTSSSDVLTSRTKKRKLPLTFMNQLTQRVNSSCPDLHPSERVDILPSLSPQSIPSPVLLASTQSTIVVEVSQIPVKAS